MKTSEKLHSSSIYHGENTIFPMSGALSLKRGLMGQLKISNNFKVFVLLYYVRFLISLSPFPVVFVEGRRLLLRRLKRPPGVHA